MTDDPDARRHGALCHRHVRANLRQLGLCRPAVHVTTTKHQPASRLQADTGSRRRLVAGSSALPYGVRGIANSVGKLPVLLAGDAAPAGTVGDYDLVSAGTANLVRLR